MKNKKLCHNYEPFSIFLLTLYLDMLILKEFLLVGKSRNVSSILGSNEPS
jgi:hypothetical protein